MLCSTTFTCSLDRTFLLNGARRRGLSNLLRESTLQDLIAIFLPHILIIAVLFITASLVYYPTMTAFLYSMLPENWKTWLWFLAFLLMEIRSMAIILAVVSQALQIHVIAFDLVNWSLQQLECDVIER